MKIFGLSWVPGSAHDFNFFFKSIDHDLARIDTYGSQAEQPPNPANHSFCKIIKVCGKFKCRKESWGEDADFVRRTQKLQGENSQVSFPQKIRIRIDVC